MHGQNHFRFISTLFLRSMEKAARDLQDGAPIANGTIFLKNIEYKIVFLFSLFF